MLRKKRSEGGREGGGERGKQASRQAGEGEGLRGGRRQRSVAVGESQRRAYHRLALIHHDRDRERLSETKGRTGGEGESTHRDDRKFLATTRLSHDSRG